MNCRIWRVTTAACLVLFCFFSAQSASGGTVTVVTHGCDFLGTGGPLWDMGLALFNYWDTQPGGAVEYVYNKDTLGLTVGRGVTGNANKIIVFDWASESDRVQGGYDEAAGDALFAMLAANGLLRSDYLHLIGHSRGTIVSTQAARRILHHGYTLNQLTLLDTEPGPAPYNAAGPARAWEGIGFVDNYYGDGTWYPVVGTLRGEPIDGAHNVYWPTSHSGVQEWYTASIYNGAQDGYYWRVTNQPKPDPTAPPTPLIPPPDVVNGGFDYGVVEGALWAEIIAGWDYHGGSGPGHVDWPPPYRLELDWDNNWKLHNWLFAPEDAVALVFDAKVDISSSNDHFYVDLERYDKFSRHYEPLSLRSQRGWATYGVDIAEFSGSVFRFWLYIDAPGWLNIVDSQVSIDNVRFVHIPEPSTLVLLSMGALILLVSAWRRRRAA